MITQVGRFCATDLRSAVDVRSADRRSVLLSRRGALTKVWFDPPGFDDRDTDLFLCDTNTCKFDGECLRIGDMVTCICDFKVRLVFCLSFFFIFRRLPLSYVQTQKC